MIKIIFQVDFSIWKLILLKNGGVRDMLCKKCGTELLPNAEFCLNCGERMEAHFADDGIKPRKEYSTGVYFVLSWFLGALMLGFNDFYAGYIKMGIYRTAATVLGFVFLVLSGFIGMAGVVLAIALIGSSVLIGVWELIMLPKFAYKLENGDVVFVRNLDKYMDRKGVEKALILKYGCSVKSWVIK